MRKLCILVLLIAVVHIRAIDDAEGADDDGVRDFLRKVKDRGTRLIGDALDRGGELIEDVVNVGRLRRRKVTPLTDCHERITVNREADSDAPIITAPQAYDIAANNSVWITSMSSRLHVRMFFKKDGKIVNDTSNCYTVSFRDENGVTKKKDILLRKEFLPDGHIPGTSTGLDLVVRWQHDDGDWYEDKTRRLKTTNLDRVFIQTDKPVYKPDQTVTIRIYLVDRNLKPISENIDVYIVGPDNVVYQKDSLEPSDSPTGINGLYQLQFELPIVPKYGLWTIQVKYGHSLRQEESIRFELQEYTLPTFSVSVSMPKVIRDSRTAQVPIQVIVRHVFGDNEAVRGSLECKAAVGKNGLFPDFYQWPSDGERLCIGADGTVNLTLDMSTYNSESMYDDTDVKKDRLLVYCNATEYFTDAKASGRAEAVFARKMYEVDFSRSAKFFKAQLPYVLQADVVLAESKFPASKVNFTVEVIEQSSRAQVSSQVVTTDVNGQLLVILRDLRDVALFIKVSPQEYDDVYEAIKVYPQEGHAIKIVPQFTSSLNLEAIKIHASDVNAIETLYFITISSGNVLHQFKRSFDMFPTHGYTETNLRLTGNLIPYVDFVVLYFNASNHAIVDTLRITVQHECQDIEKISSDKTQYEPRETMKLSFHGYVNTGVAPLMVDNAALLLGKYGTVTHQTIIDSVSDTENGCEAETSRQALSQLHVSMMGQNLVESCEQTRKKRSTHEELSIPEVGENCCEWARNEQYNVETWKCHNMIVSLMKSTASHIDQFCLTEAFRCCKEVTTHFYDEAPRFSYQYARLESGKISESAGGSSGAGKQVHEMPPDQMTRHSFPESVVLDVGKIGTTLKYNVDQPMPDSITSWNVQAIYLNPTSGMCIPQAKDVDVLKDVFLRIHLPHKIVRGEHVRMSVMLHNRLEELVSADITLENVDSGLCYDSSKGVHSIRVRATSTEYRHWYFVAKEVGTHTITISAVKTHNASHVYDRIQQTLHVHYEGIHRTDKLDSVLLGHTPQEYTHKVRVATPSDELAVANSTKVYVKLSGNMMGPNVDFLLKHMRKTKRTKIQYVLRKLSSTFYAAWYLNTSSSLEENSAKKAKKHIRSGVKDLLSFKQTDGSFKNTNRNSSLWLTAAALKLMNEIKREFPAYAKVSDVIICEASQWLMNKQNSGGEFEEESPDSPRKARNKVALTSYISQALHDLQCSDETVKERASDAAREAVRYIHRWNFRSADVYTKSHVAVSLAKYDHASADTHYRDLSTHVHDITERDVDQVTSKDVETVSHALISSLKLRHADDYSHYAQWLLKKRNEKGEFILSQDTDAALEALSHFAAEQYSRIQPSSCTVAASDSELSDYNTTVDPWETDHIDVTHLGEEIELSCAGQSAVHAEVFYEYHTLQDSLACNLTLNASATEVKRRRRGGRRPRSVNQCGSGGDDDDEDNNVREYKVQFCAGPDSLSNTVFIEAEINLLSGHQPADDSLTTNHDRSAVIVTMTLVENQAQCVVFETQSPRAKIDNLQPARITVQNEDTGLVCNLLYHTDNNHPLTQDDPCYE